MGRIQPCAPVLTAAAHSLFVSHAIPLHKTSLEREAAAEDFGLAVLDAAAREWLQKNDAAKWIGVLASGDAQRSEPLPNPCAIVCGGAMAAQRPG